MRYHHSIAGELVHSTTRGFGYSTGHALFKTVGLPMALILIVAFVLISALARR